MLSDRALAGLREVTSRDRVLTAREDLLTYAGDATPLHRHLPAAVVIPRDGAEVARIVRLANEEAFSIVPRGAGTGLSAGAVPTPNGIVLLFPTWNRILEIDVENLTAWVEPGVVTAELHRAVEAQGLFYPPDPGSMRVCTLGGNVAENAGGLRGLKYGVTKHYVQGLEVVLPTGETVRLGGKSMKDVAGYNLVDLLVGSEGTLGIFTKILVRLIPRPDTTRTILALFDTIGAAGDAVAGIIAERIVPSTLEFLDRTTIRAVESFARLGLPEDAAALLLIEVDGRSLVVEQDAVEVSRICRLHGARTVRSAATPEEAEDLRTARRAAFSALARIGPTTILEDATVPRSAVPAMLARIHEIAARHEVTIGIFGHAGDGNLHPTCLTDARDGEAIRRADRAFEEIFSAAIALGGTITGEHGVGLAKRRFLERQVGEPVIRFMRQIKAVMDPNQVLNPGKIFEPAPRCEHPPVGHPRYEAALA
ncbi:MAG TPA: FAD-linked oxidase C-terminal domain-containing protein [Gemmatimonadota bacterium]|nr:FAD-linked oxidase C-terminal domain-containing protein [Gemmatimonadota bacterium]